MCNLGLFFLLSLSSLSLSPFFLLGQLFSGRGLNVMSIVCMEHIKLQIHIISVCWLSLTIRSYHKYEEYVFCYANRIYIPAIQIFLYDRHYFIQFSAPFQYIPSQLINSFSSALRPNIPFTFHCTHTHKTFGP